MEKNEVLYGIFNERFIMAAQLGKLYPYFNFAYKRQNSGWDT